MLSIREIEACLTIVGLCSKQEFFLMVEQSHPGLSGEEVAKLCRCLNYEKLTLESCKDLAKSRRIPPGIAVQALVSQRSKLQMATTTAATITTTTTTAPYSPAAAPDDEEKEQLRQEMQRMERKVKELEKTCTSLKGQMMKMAKKSLSHGSISRGGMPKLC